MNVLEKHSDTFVIMLIFLE